MNYTKLDNSNGPSVEGSNKQEKSTSRGRGSRGRGSRGRGHSYSSRRNSSIVDNNSQGKISGFVSLESDSIATATRSHTTRSTSQNRTTDQPRGGSKIDNRPAASRGGRGVGGGGINSRYMFFIFMV